MSCYIVVAQGEHDFSEGACPCGTEPPELGGKMAVERHVGTPDCVNETCACGSAPKPEDGSPVPLQKVALDPYWLCCHEPSPGPHADFCPLHDTAKERRERIATAVLGGFAAMLGYVDEQQRVPHSGKVLSYVTVEARRWADALIVELDKGEK